MAISPKQTVDEFEALVLKGWEPTVNEVADKFYPEDPKHPLGKFRRQHLARLLVKRVRHSLEKHEGVYFYSVQGKFKLMTTFEDRHEVTMRLWSLTNGFTHSTGTLIDDTFQAHPNLLTSPFWVTIKAKIETIGDIAQMVTKEIEKNMNLLPGGKSAEANESPIKQIES